MAESRQYVAQACASGARGGRRCTACGGVAGAIERRKAATMTQAPAGFHYCRYGFCERLVPNGVNFCELDRAFVAAEVRDFHAYMCASGGGHLGSQEIVYYQELEKMLKEDRNERK